MRATLALLLVPITAVAVAAPAAAAPPTAPGAPGATQQTQPADKGGFGTAYGGDTSRIWFTVQRAGGAGELFYPDLDTPAARRLEFVVASGGSAVRVSEASTVETSVPDPRSLSFRQVNVSRDGTWRLAVTYVTDPRRPVLMARVEFSSRAGQRLYALYDPSLNDNGNDDTGSTVDGALVARDGTGASYLAARPSFGATSSGYAGTSDGWTDLRADGRLDTRYARAADPGNVVQTAEVRLSHGKATLALGFDTDPEASLRTGFDRVNAEYARSWHRYVGRLHRTPASLTTPRERDLYTVSAMVLAASEDKANRGAFVASPSMPWVWGTEQPSGPYYLVWSRDLYQIATALIAAGDRDGALRALDFLFERQQKPDGSFPQNTDVRGEPVWTSLQLDEVALPIVLAGQLGRTDAATWDHVRRAADFLVSYPGAPNSPQERWENQSGYSPATIAAEIAGLVVAARIARQNGDPAASARYLATADDWQRRVESWTVTRTGPYDPKPYYLRLTKDGNPDAGTTYAIGDSGPSGVDQRAVVDPSFLELVRLGAKRAGDPIIANTLSVVDAQLSYDTPIGRFWHRFTYDGYGETLTGGPWNFDFPADSRATRGRGWPLFNGERGEYQLLAGDRAGARGQLRTMAATAGAGLMMAEQVWDTQPPGFPPGTNTTSATPLAWTHAQYIRLAANVAAGTVAERPAEVASRYAP
ncbi:glucan 1,4-alpha-glucosidase [Virgisporangium aliadipatigenens]|uniref:Glucan 1,4-alpha-glucosidase n=1 Tax=Virgisporangium aliadipatigenens TaxID=741659 RepID=A0A8J4DRF8_9ACTN|nr:glycoside hydrolase family 15 protein [Virgisporangium aliadipatigenens]GIJ47619.1 glucan 1,4-alpha-glucosidase [Virgisporangium aliadipatigenens]